MSSSTTASFASQYDRPSTPAMDSDHASDSELDDQPLPVPASLPAQGGGITFISPFATFNQASAPTQPNMPPVVSPHMQSSSAHAPFGSPFMSQSTRLPAFSSIAIQRRGSHINTSIRGELAPDDRRRNSVDAAVLAEFTNDSGSYQRRPSKRLRQEQSFISSPLQAPEHKRESQSLPNPESGAHWARPTGNRSGSTTETMFADHLTAILQHSLSLCSGQGETMLDLLVRGDPQSQGVGSPAVEVYDDSPRSSISATSPPTAQDSHFPQSRIHRLPSIPDMLSPLRRMQLIEQMQEWSFDALDLDADELWECASIMFECVMQMEGVEIGVPMERIRALLLALRSAYHARNGYHNFAHATDVLQATYTFLVALQVAPPLSTLYSSQTNLRHERWQRPDHVDLHGGMGQLLRPMDVFALMIAAIGHDVGHPGLSNAYMVNARTPLAQVYGDKSVLENFHTVTLIQMLRKHGLGHLFGAATRAPSVHDPECRKVLFASVLATDMSRHFPFVAKLQDLARRLAHHPRRLEEVEEDRLLLCSSLMKCADISNPTRPHLVAKHWSTALLEEWTVQAKIEEEFKLPVSVMILNPTEAKAQAKSQVGFINLFTQPLFDAMASFIPEFSRFSGKCREGRRIWEAIIVQPDDQFRPTEADSATLGSPNRTPRPAFSERLSANNVASDAEASSPRMYRRRPPPRPLSMSTNSHTRSSIDSALSASTPGLLTPNALSPFAATRFPSFSSVSSVGSVGITESQTRCIGTCGEVTAKCVPCLVTGSAEPARRESCVSLGSADKRLLAMPGMPFTSAPIIVEDDTFVQDIWPPHPFYPQTALSS